MICPTCVGTGRQVVTSTPLGTLPPRCNDCGGTGLTKPTCIICGLPHLGGTEHADECPNGVYLPANWPQR